jgi:hypothetical protein
MTFSLRGRRRTGVVGAGLAAMPADHTIVPALPLSMKVSPQLGHSFAARNMRSIARWNRVGIAGFDST